MVPLRDRPPRPGRGEDRDPRRRRRPRPPVPAPPRRAELGPPNPPRPRPLVTVYGRIRPELADTLRVLAARAGPDQAAAAAARYPTPSRRITEEPPVPTGSLAPGHAAEPVHYLPAEPVPYVPAEPVPYIPAGRLVADDHPSAVYAVAGHWGLRLGPPVALTPTGLLVFQPLALAGNRITVEHPATHPVTPHLPSARLGVYRYQGLGTWEQVATLHTPDELTRTDSINLQSPAPSPRPGLGQSTAP